ncbi:MAG: hypothetical protein R2881_11320, partial [Eubacteriales bacterium]
DAGVTGGLGRGQFVNGYAYGNTEMNTVEIAAQIANLGDTNENKVMLQELLNAYEKARAAEQGADAEKLTQEEMKALGDATNAAADALKTALENAGLDAQIQMRQQQSIEYQARVITAEGDGETPSEDGIFASFFQWLDSLFK